MPSATRPIEDSAHVARMRIDGERCCQMAKAEEQFQCHRRRRAPRPPSARVAGCSIVPRCILGNTKSVGLVFRVMQAITRPPFNYGAVHLSCGRRAA